MEGLHAKPSRSFADRDPMRRCGDCPYAERKCGKQIRRHVERCVSDKIRTVAAKRVSGVPLKKFGLDERGFQDILFRSLDHLIGDDELLLLMQSRHWQEEPDLMALDRDGNPYIFEIKVWEAHQENLLQVLRYGQINGASDYDELERI
jgi:hypothetical protein